MIKVASVGATGISHMRNWIRVPRSGEPAAHILCGTVSEPEASTLDPASDPLAATVHPGAE